VVEDVEGVWEEDGACEEGEGGECALNMV
jgi:hypothetical protein